MPFSFEMIEDKVEFFEGWSLAAIEKQINEQIENNKALLLTIKSVSHQMCFDPDHKKPYYSAVVHFQLKGRSA